MCQLVNCPDPSQTRFLLRSREAITNLGWVTGMEVRSSVGGNKTDELSQDGNSVWFSPRPKRAVR